MSPRLHLRTILAMVLEVALAYGLVAFAVATWHPAVIVVVMVVVATRQHALFILFHDAVHGNVARHRRLNDFVTNLLIGVPQLVPVQLYRRLHLAHHARLGSETDPERLFLYRGQTWNYRPLPMRQLIWQLAGDLFLVNNVKTLYHFGAGAARAGLPPAKTWPEFWAVVLLAAGGLGTWAVLDATTFLRFVLVWFVPLLTLTQLIQKVRSFAEHAALGEAELTYSWRPGLLGRLVLWPYNINYHREHHDAPRVPWYRLPAEFVTSRGRAGRGLAAILWSGRW